MMSSSPPEIELINNFIYKFIDTALKLLYNSDTDNVVKGDDVMSVYIWIALFAVLVVVEAITVQLTTIWFAAGALVAGIASICNAPNWLQWVLFLAVSVILVIFTRKFAKNVLKAEPKPTNADTAIGQQGIVCEEINNLDAKGAVKLNGMVWTARSDAGTIIPGETTVPAVRIEGVKLIVKKTNEED